MTGLWGLLAALTSVRLAIAVAGALLLATPALLPRERHAQAPGRERIAISSTRSTIGQ